MRRRPVKRSNQGRTKRTRRCGRSAAGPSGVRAAGGLLLLRERERVLSLRQGVPTRLDAHRSTADATRGGEVVMPRLVCWAVVPVSQGTKTSANDQMMKGDERWKHVAAC